MVVETACNERKISAWMLLDIIQPTTECPTHYCYNCYYHIEIVHLTKYSTNAWSFEIKMDSQGLLCYAITLPVLYDRKLHQTSTLYGDLND